MENIYNQDGIVNSLQVSRLDYVPTGNTEFGIIVLLKNVTENNITIQIKPAGQKSYIETVLYPGWNPELVSGIKGATAKSIQYGY